MFANQACPALVDGYINASSLDYGTSMYYTALARSISLLPNMAAEAV